jgi:hypothetical protein
MEKCLYCNQPATGYTLPPACEEHADLLLFIDYLTKRDEPVTVETVTALVAECQANNGSVYIDRFDVEIMLPGVLANMPGEIRFLGGAA